MLVPDTYSGSDSAISNPLSVGIFGSTGSIGCSGLEVIRCNPDHFKVFALAAGTNFEKLGAQIREFRPRFAALFDADERARSSLKAACGNHTEMLYGAESICELAAHPECDTILAAIVGFSGLSSVLAALKAGKRVALANKESLVCGGKLVERALRSANGSIVPVDSEHSALFQALQGERIGEVSRLVLTASGGPFLNTPAGELSRITPEQAVKHPRWNMGAKISVDSATLVNKALELIEAHWLFGMPCEKIGIVIHPQSIIHSIVEFEDGSQIAQLGVPDMKGPIAYALNYPYGRLKGTMKPLDLVQTANLQFFELDHQRFPAVRLALEALKGSSALSAVFNIANELAVAAFLRGGIAFDRIVPLIEQCLERFGGQEYENLEDLIALQNNVGAYLEL